MLHVCTMYAPSHNIAWEIMYTVFGILYHLLGGLLYFCCIVITVCCSHTYHLNETKRTMHPPFRVQRFNIARSKKWNRNYIFKNVNCGWTLTQSYKRSYLHVYLNVICIFVLGVLHLNIGLCLMNMPSYLNIGIM